MSKELEKEYLEDLDHYDEGIGIHSTSYAKCKERLIRLAQIENAKPSEAIECLEKIGTIPMIVNEKTYGFKPIKKAIPNTYNTIEQALLKAEKLEKALDIIRNKKVDIDALCVCGNLEKYNKLINPRIFASLTQQEFDLLKEVLE